MFRCKLTSGSGIFLSAHCLLCSTSAELPYRLPLFPQSFLFFVGGLLVSNAFTIMGECSSEMSRLELCIQWSVEGSFSEVFVNVILPKVKVLIWVKQSILKGDETSQWDCKHIYLTKVGIKNSVLMSFI